MLEGARGVVVAVSGGPDSVALLDLLLRLSPLPLHVAHLDHRLRGAESAADADFVRGLAAGLKLPVTVASIDVLAEARARGRGIEEVAREARYGFLLETALASGCDRIATGHTMNDQAETFLMRLARGAGLRGLAGMRPVAPAHLFDPSRDFDEFPRGPSGLPARPSIIRPLLCLTRDEVEGYCRDYNLAFRTDQSNATADYTRNRVRRDVLPALRSINPRVVERISRASELIAADHAALEKIAADYLDGARLGGREVEAAGLTRALGIYRASAFSDQPSALRRRMIIKALERARAGLPPAERRGEITSVHVAAVDGLLEKGASGRRVTLPGGLEVWRDFGALVLKSSNLRAPDESPRECEISCDSPEARAGGLRITLLCDQSRGLLEASLAEARRERERGGRDWMTAVLDANATPSRLIVRPRVAGERARVLGQRQIKKLKILMIDHRIPSSLRAAWPVIATPDGRYVWSPGLPPSVEFAAHDETSGLAILRASGI